MRHSATAVLPALLPLLLVPLATGCAALRPPGGVAPAERYPIVPAPATLEPRSGELRLAADSGIHLAAGSAAADPAADAAGGAAASAVTDAAAVAELLAEGVRRIGGPSLALALVSTAGAAAAEPDTGIILRLEGTTADSLDESYRLDVNGRRVLLAAASPAGLFRGTQTLLQLVTRSADGGASVPAVRITDAPRFPYRGMHLDVGRHFFPPEFIRKYIDLLALYRFNVFHWHLTEDQGWRIEIDAYPRLTQVGARRAETTGDGTPYGGYYTKEEISDVVAYAAARHITIIPEIEMPGHALAALAAYPELACTAGPFEVGTRWGVFEDVLCPHERTFEFLETVLAEVMALFPSPYIHIGGDEAPKRRWRESPVAQEVMRREGLADEDELQSWFIRRIERFLNAHGRRLIGWDEILEGGLAPNATVMSWRGMAGGIEAARQGRDVVMTPTSHAYFDYLQGPA
ncbi:MAG: beta-N-acetylhexosaminidase, partial [Gemmatimonadota bacterium]